MAVQVVTQRYIDQEPEETVASKETVLKSVEIHQAALEIHWMHGKGHALWVLSHGG